MNMVDMVTSLLPISLSDNLSLTTSKYRSTAAGFQLLDNLSDTTDEIKKLC